MPISAVDAITLAFQHTKRQLIEPFRFWQWTRLAVVGLLAGEMSSGGGFNFPTNFNFPKQGGTTQHLLGSGLGAINPALYAGLIAVVIAAGLVFVVILMFISSVMRFILFDSVLAKECHIRQGWNRRQGPGWKLFLWHLGLSVVTLVVLAVLVGIPVAVAFARGWFRAPREHIAALVVGGILLFCFLFVFFIAAALIQVFTKDFVVPQMALEGVGAIEAWRRLWPMILAEKGSYAIYAGMKIVLAIGTGIVITIVTTILALLVAIPVVGLGIIAVLTGKSAGLTWDAFTITLAIVAGSVLFAAFMFVTAMISVPVIVFFPAYSIYYFAPRYRALSLAVYPPPLTQGTPGPPEEPPPMVLAPEPAG